jgi:hypothetical protein
MDACSPEEMWERFIAHLNKVEPLGKRDEIVPHKAFIGSIEKYRRIFLEAQRAPPPMS